MFTDPRAALKRMDTMELYKQAGMSHIEAYNAVTLADEEGREYGTAQEEMARAATNAAKTIEVNIPMEEADVRNVLLIVGVSHSGEWMNSHITGEGDVSPGMRPLDPSLRQTAKELKLRFTTVDFYSGRTNNVQACLRALNSDAFHAVIVCDLSNSDIFSDFIDALGPGLCTFANEGGCVAFPTSEGLQLADQVLPMLFGTSWKSANYRRQTFTKVLDNQVALGLNFSSSCTTSYNAKTCSLRSVPLNESMYSINGTTGPNVEVGIAVHGMGTNGGSIAYFGDVNMEPATALLLLSYVSRRCKGSFAAKNDPKLWFVEMMSEKQSGNQAFRVKKFSAAIQHYKAAILLCDAQTNTGSGISNAQRSELLNIHSNLAEASLKLQLFDDANRHATLALAINGKHEKSLFRRARAFMGNDQLDQDRLAAKDLRKIFMNRALSGSDYSRSKDAAETLFETVEDRIRERECTNNAQAEVETLHQFFVQWFDGKLPDEAFDSFIGRFADEFSMRPPGNEAPQPPIGKDQIAEMRSKKGTTSPLGSWAIYIKDVALKVVPGTYYADCRVTGTYVELQQRGTTTNGRRSTVVFKYDISGCGGGVEPVQPHLCQWLSLDEQWLSEDELAQYDFNAMAEEQNIQEMIQTTVDLEKEAAALENELNGEDL